MAEFFDLMRAAIKAEKVLTQVATDIESTAQLIEWHALCEEAREDLRAALAAFGVTELPTSTSAADPGVQPTDGGKAK